MDTNTLSIPNNDKLYIKIKSNDKNNIININIIKINIINKMNNLKTYLQELSNNKNTPCKKFMLNKYAFDNILNHDNNSEIPIEIIFDSLLCTNCHKVDLDHSVCDNYFPENNIFKTCYHCGRFKNNHKCCNLFQEMYENNEHICGKCGLDLFSHKSNVEKNKKDINIKNRCKNYINSLSDNIDDKIFHKLNSKL
jgi:hypothetical protein